MENNMSIMENYYLKRYNNTRYKLKDGKDYIKEYWYDIGLIFEGEYLKEERNGKGKEYGESGYLFEGEYLKGEQWNGKEKSKK